jgi:hypothetical protein
MSTRQQQPQPGTTATGSVGPGTGPPKGHYWDRLKEAKAKGDKAALGELLDELEIHGYDRGGQIMTATLAAFNEAGGTSGRRRSRGR